MPPNDPRKDLPLSAKLGDGARDLWRGTVTRRLAASGPVPDALVYRPVPLDVGSPETADEMLRGLFTFEGSTVRVERGDPWRLSPPNVRWAEILHGFEWLRHFRAGDGPASRTAARRYVDGWLHKYAKGAGFPWRPAIVGRRVTNWTMNAALLMENAEPLYRSEFLKSLATQGRYLSRTAGRERLPADRLSAGMGLAYAGLCVPNHRELLGQGVQIFTKAASEMSLPDGGPVSRNPSDLLDRLEMMLQLKTDLDNAGEADLAASLAPHIRKGAPVLRMLRHGDGGLGLFHGGREEGAERVNRVLVESGETSPPPGLSPDSGYMRLGTGRITVLFDVGTTPSGRAAKTAHAGPLAVEVSVGRRRLITNCGSGLHLDAAWEIGCRSSVAHSTLTLADHPPGRFAGAATARLRRLVSGPRAVECDREDDDEGIWALAAHDGYAARYGLIHYRRLFLSPDGGDLRGEDTLTLVKGGAKILERARARRKSPDGPGFDLRFHLHPDVLAETTQSGVDLALPSGEVWRLMQSGGVLGLEESIYIGSTAAPRPTMQIVVRGQMQDEGGQLRWALKRLDASEVRDYGPDGEIGDPQAEPVTPPEA